MEGGGQLIAHLQLVIIQSVGACIKVNIFHNQFFTINFF